MREYAPWAYLLVAPLGLFAAVLWDQFFVGLVFYLVGVWLMWRLLKANQKRRRFDY